jgi:hypothetical protein
VSSDGGLHKLFRDYMPQPHFQRIETGGIARGVPDFNGCYGGVDVWIENKWTSGWVVKMRPAQVGWIERRARAGGRCFVAVRQTGRKRDDLWLFNSDAARLLIDGARIDEIPEVTLGHWGPTPVRWDWDTVLTILFAPEVLMEDGR